MKRIVKQPVQVYRNGKFVTIEPSVKPVDFTDDELKSINSVNPNALDKIVIADEPKAEVKKTA